MLIAVKAFRAYFDSYLTLRYRFRLDYDRNKTNSPTFHQPDSSSVAHMGGGNYRSGHCISRGACGYLRRVLGFWTRNLFVSSDGLAHSRLPFEYKLTDC